MKNPELSKIKSLEIICLGIFLLQMIVSGCKKNVYDITNRNYGKKIEIYAKEFGLPAEYLKALVILECSGKRDFTPRFEKKVFERLKQVRSGERESYDNILQSDIHDATDAALRNLATSWGPFQIMGYKCIHLGLKLEDLRGENAVYWGIKWINLEYGDYLRQNQFEESFRIHNTGKKDGRTYDPDYVPNGLRHIKKFTKNRTS